MPSPMPRMLPARALLILVTLALGLTTLLQGCSREDQASPQGSAVFNDRAFDDTWQLPGLQAPVELARDIYGIPHIYAETVQDMALTQGYLIARDRFWQMDVFRRLATGQLTTLAGVVPLVIDVDELFRAINLTQDGRMVYEVIYETMEEADQQLLEAFADGVNLYLDHAATGKQGARMPPEYNELLFGILASPSAEDLPRWKPSDSLAIGRLQQWLLSGSNPERKLLFGELDEKSQGAQADWFDWLVRFQPPVTSATTLHDWPGVVDGAPAAEPDTALVRLRRLREAFPQFFPTDVGSNNWVIGPGKSASGNVLVANDPHLMMFNPPMFYQAHVNLKELGEPDGWNAYGVLFPGIPIFMIAHTENIAWGVTVLGYDVMDVYEEEVSEDGRTVRRGNDQIPIEYSMQTYCHGYSGECIDRPLAYVPGHGPRIGGRDDFHTFRWTGHEPTLDFKAFIELLDATTVPEAMDAIAHFRVGAQSFVIGDIRGNIGYYGASNIPLRNPACPRPPYLPQDGASGDCEWLGYAPREQELQVLNPERGYVATANADIVGTTFDGNLENDELYYWYTRDEGYRMGRLQQLLDAQESFDKLDMERMQADHYSLEGAMLAPHVVTAGTNRPDLVDSAAVAEALQRLDEWSYFTPTGLPNPFLDDDIPSAREVADSVATSIYYTWIRLLADTLLANKYDYWGLPTPGYDGYSPLTASRVALHALRNPDDAGGVWNDVSTVKEETAEEIILLTLAMAVEWLTERFGTENQNEWTWGTLHYVRFADPYGFLGADVRAVGPYPRPGAHGTLDAGGYTFMNDSYVQLAGAQMRMITELQEGRIRSWNSLPGGQVHDRESPFYDNLGAYWMTNTTYEVPFYTEDVAGKIYRLTLVVPE